MTDEPKHLPVLIRSNGMTVYNDSPGLVDMMASGNRIWLWGQELSVRDYQRGWALVSDYRRR